MKKNRGGNALDFFGGPLMIEAATCEAYLQSLNARVSMLQYTGRREAGRLVVENGVAVIPVYGVLMNKPNSIMEMLFGGASYAALRVDFMAALESPDVKAIAFDIDSPGGVVAGAFDLADEIFKARGTKPIYAILSETAYSAAYAIASAADKIFIPRTGGAGSIGVVAAHIDQSKADEKEGLAYTMIYAGDHKIDQSSHAPLSDAARAGIQKDVDAIYGLFAETVARNRGMKVADVRAQQAAIYRGKAAVEAGLADTVASWSQAMNKITGKSIKRGGTFNMKVIVDQIKALVAEHPDLTIEAVVGSMGFIPALAEGSVVMTQADIDKVKEDAMAAGVSQGKEDALAGVKALGEICTLAGAFDKLPGFIAAGASVEDAQKAIMESRQTAEGVRSTVGATSTGEVNPLLADAKKRAGIS